MGVQDKMRNTQKQVEELSEKMNTLLSEKAALESRNRVLEQARPLPTPCACLGHVPL
jgi:hypothetical protein